MTYYTWRPGGGGVLATGTIGWIPALESCTGTLPACPAPVVQAVTGNIFKLFGRRESTTRRWPTGSSTTKTSSQNSGRAVPRPAT